MSAEPCLNPTEAGLLFSATVRSLALPAVQKERGSVEREREYRRRTGSLGEGRAQTKTETGKHGKRVRESGSGG